MDNLSNIRNSIRNMVRGTKGQSLFTAKVLSTDGETCCVDADGLVLSDVQFLGNKNKSYLKLIGRMLKCTKIFAQRSYMLSKIESLTIWYQDLQTKNRFTKASNGLPPIASHIANLLGRKNTKKINTKFFINKYNKTGQRPVGVCRIVRGTKRRPRLPELSCPHLPL